MILMLQQCLPFTVLKQDPEIKAQMEHRLVATVLTVYGIETPDTFKKKSGDSEALQQCLPFTVLKQNFWEIRI